MARVGIIGASGYAGAELVRILATHPGVELTCLTCRQEAGQAFDRIYPALTNWVDLTCDSYDVDAVAQKADVVFTALPHQLPMTLIPELLDRGIKVIDLSADFRFKDAAIYEKHYQPHTAVQLLQKAVYGLSEVYREKICKAHLVGNPGCYPTSVLLPLIPPLKAGLIELDGIVADAKSGVSGAGRGASLTTHFCQVNESFKAYKVAAHRHAPEMEAILSEQAGQSVTLTFVPHLMPITRGMETTIYATLRDGVSGLDIENCLAGYYKERPFVRLRGAKPPDTLQVKGTNFIDIAFAVDMRQQRLILMSAIDNLVKGAAGQAVQNMNLMLGLEETQGFWQTPYPL